VCYSAVRVSLIGLFDFCVSDAACSPPDLEAPLLADGAGWLGGGAEARQEEDEATERLALVRSYYVGPHPEEETLTTLSHTQVRSYYVGPRELLATAAAGAASDGSRGPGQEGQGQGGDGGAHAHYIRCAGGAVRSAAGAAGRASTASEQERDGTAELVAAQRAMQGAIRQGAIRGRARRGAEGAGAEGAGAAVFVFACFSQPKKITPALFMVWAQLLRRRPRSLLWLTQVQ
jgi:hypothetical protein